MYIYIVYLSLCTYSFLSRSARILGNFDALRSVPRSGAYYAATLQRPHECSYVQTSTLLCRALEERITEQPERELTNTGLASTKQAQNHV